MKFYDTNAILELPNQEITEKFFISSVSLQELEHIKTSRNKDESVKFKARKATKWLDNNQELFEVIVYDRNTYGVLEMLGLPEDPDMKICACADYINGNDNVEFVTNDIACKLLAKNVFHIQVSSINSAKINAYCGYKKISGNAAKINAVMENIDYNDWSVNEYVIIENTDDGSTKEMRYDGERFVPLKLPPSKYIKAKNALQRCALDILNNQDIKIVAILGNYGSGKTHLAVQMALYAINEKGWQSKCLAVREVRGEGEQIGYLPGEKESKIGDFFKPLEQQLEGGEYQLESLKSRGVLEANTPYFMKGTTYNDTVMIVDEAEDFTAKQIKLVGTRLGQDSRIVFSGDYKQSVVDATESNPLLRMCDELKGNPMFACIYLDEDVRSEASKLFASMFED